MGKTQNLGHLAHIVAYDAENHITVPAGITMHTNQLVASQSWVTTALGSYALSSSLSSYVPTSRTITINGTTYDLSANREWNITSMIYPAAGIALSTGSAWGSSITNNSANWNTAYGWGNHASAGYVPQSRTITINGVSLDLSADRSWTIAASSGVTSFNTRTGAVTLSSSDVTSALGYTPYNSTNPSGYITSSGNISGYAMSLNGYANQTVYTILDGPANGPVIKVRYDSATANRYIDIGTKDGNGVYTEGFKIYNGGTPTWAGNAIIHAGNIGSQSVSYASTAGAASASSFLTQANATWGARIQLGGNGDPGANSALAVVQATDGNLHLDCGTSKSTYINYYRNGTIYLNGSTYYISSNGANYNGTAANADTLDGYHGSNYPGKNGNSYYQVDTWLQLTGTHGLYCPSVNDAHFFPNSNSYGSWKVLGSRNGWRGLHFGEGTGMTLMMNETEFGFHREGHGWYARFTSGTGHFNISGSAASASSSTTARYFPTNYVGGQQTNPQVYFNSDQGLNVAMTGAWSVWSDTLWVNGYSGSDVPWMCALHFLRNSEPRFAISAQQRGSTGYGSYYEVITAYNIASQTVSTANNLSGFDKTNPSFGAVYATNWFRSYGDSGLYNQDYACHWRRNASSSYGTWEAFGYNKNGYGGLNIHDPSGYYNNIMFESGNGGMYQENGAGWGWYYNRGQDCFVASGSGSSGSYRFISSGSANIQGDLAINSYTGFGGNTEWGNGTTQYHGSNTGYNWRDWGGWGGYWWSRNGGDMIMNLYALYSVTGSISDMRYKKDVVALPYGLNEIMQLNPIKYHYNLPKESMLSNDPDYFLGFSAQEVQGIIPEAVHEKIAEDSENMKGMLAITMNELIPVTVQAIKEQQVMINNQAIKIQKLETLVNQLLNN